MGCVFVSKCAHKRLVLDVDDTLYSVQSGVQDAIKRQIARTPARFLHGFVGLKTDAHGHITNFPDLLVALRARDPRLLRDYIRHVYAIDQVPYDRLQPNVPLSLALAQHPGGVGLYTSGVYDHHVKLVLHKLGLADVIPKSKVVDALVSGPGRLKPTLAGYRHAVALLGTVPEETIYVDDGAANVAAAKQLGAVTVWVNENRHAYPPSLPPPDFELTQHGVLPLLIAGFRSDAPPRPSIGINAVAARLSARDHP